MVLAETAGNEPVLIDAARDLGASKRDVFTKVIFPYIRQEFLPDFLWPDVFAWMILP